MATRSLYNYTQQQTPGTLSSQGLYVNPNVPRQSQAQGLNGTDNRGYTREVQGNELVSNQLNRLTAENNPYIQNAENRAMQSSNRRGLMNSSIAAGAGRRAAIESALPIAQADAQTYGQAAGQNLDAMNANLMQERDIANRMLQGSRELGQRQNEIDAQQEINNANIRSALQRQREGLAFQGEQQGLDRQQQEYMSRLGYEQQSGLMGQEFNYNMMRDASQAQIQDWLSNQDYQRNYMGTLAMMSFANRNSALNSLAQSVISEPEVYGNQDFLQRMFTNLNSLYSMLDSFIPDTFDLATGG